MHPDFLLPTRALSVIFRAKVRDALDRAGLLHRVPDDVWCKRWVVHAQHAGNGEKVLDYIARYLYRIAIANSRLESFEDGQVTFRYRDQAGRLQLCRLPAPEFIRRFLQHVLPRGFAKVRSYGLYSPTCNVALECARALLEQAQADVAPTAVDHHAPDIDSGDDHETGDPICPYCRHGVMKIVRDIPPAPRPRPSTRGPP